MRQRRTVVGVLLIGIAAIGLAWPVRAGAQAAFGGGRGGAGGRGGGGGAAAGATSSATRARADAERGAASAMGPRGRGMRGAAPAAPHEIAVDEIVNFHHHNIPLPKPGQSIALDARWGSPTASTRQPAVLEIGLATTEFNGTTDLLPANLALVIDRSGSMAAADKMTLVKAALQTLISNLRPHDIVSIIAFDTTADVLLPATKIGNAVEHRRVIENIRPNGSTNISDGLALGYQEVSRNYRDGYTNRVILLTDGIANIGVTDPSRIADNSGSFTERGIDLSTIGVGQDIDDNLLRAIAKRGHGLYYFLADSRDVAKSFAYEAQILLSQVARDVRIEVTFDSTLNLNRVYGYAPRVSAGRIALDMDNFNNGMTEVVLLEYSPGGSGPVTVRLTYFDIGRQRVVEEVQRIELAPANGRNNDFLEDKEVRKNYTIAGIAQAMSDMQQNWRRNDLRTAESIVSAAVSEALDRYPLVEDADIRAQLQIAESFLATLRSFNNSRPLD
ncbi:MAG TPA: VWA domain-containing protein [Terriglobia bacterium]|nr:VWA domain-containing protein [Terriglobia bacterium]